MSEDRGEQVEWNMAQLINMELANLNGRANSSFIQGHFKEAMNCQKSKRMTAGFSFNEEERNKLDELEQKIDLALMSYGGLTLLNKSAQFRSNMAYKELIKLYPKYVQLLNDILDAHGWFGARKKDAGRMKI